jgi:hypothetical protein
VLVACERLRAFDGADDRELESIALTASGLHLEVQAWLSA